MSSCRFSLVYAGGSVLLGMASLWAGPGLAGEIQATGGALGLGTTVNGQLGGSCVSGGCQVGGGTGAGSNLFHRFSAFDTRGAITGVNLNNGSYRNVFVGVTNPMGSFIDKVVSLSSAGNLFWLSPGGIAISGAGSFQNVQQLNLSTATGWKVGSGVFDVAGTTAGQAALLTGTPVTGLAGAVTEASSLASLGLQKNGDLSLSGGLLTVDVGLLLDAHGGNVLLQAAGIQAPGGSVEISGHSVLQNAPIGVSGASGGSVTIQAGGSVLNSAPIQARGASGAGGTIAVRAGEAVVQTAAATLEASGNAGGGTVSVQSGTSLTSSATITATGTGPGATGGTVEVTAPSINLAAAQLEASGSAGGGAVRVGGGWQGAPLSLGGANAISTTLDSSTGLKADATQAGNGGQVVVWADRATWVDGTISARGGEAGGDGGFVETSGREQLAVSRAPDASAPRGKGGTWLLDPNNLTVNANGPESNVTGFPSAITTGDSAVIAASTINAALNAGTSVSLTTSAGGTEEGDITVSAPISKTAGATAALTLNAHNNINIDADISSASGALNLVLVPNLDNAGGGAVLVANNSAISLNGGDLSLAGNGDASLGANSAFQNLRFVESGAGNFIAPSPATLNGVTIAADMTFGGTLTIVNDLLLAGGVTVDKGANDWNFVTTGPRTLGLATRAGSATVLSSGGAIVAGFGVDTQTLTIGSGVTLQSVGTGTSRLSDSSSTPIINNGTIASTTGGVWSIEPTSFTNNGALTATSGTVSISAGSWSNGSTGVFNVGSSGTLNLGGSFTNANALAFSGRNGGSVSITGTFDLAGTTLDVGPAGLFGFDGITPLSGTLFGGTLISTDTTAPVLASSSGTLNGMTIGSSLVINGTLNIANDLLLADGVRVDKGANNWNFVTGGSRTLGLDPDAIGATVLSSGGAIVAGFGVDTQTLTIGSGVTLQSVGTGTSRLSNSSSTPIINNGTIASTTGGVWSIEPTSFTNGATGSLIVAAGASVATGGNSFINAGAIEGSGTINMGSGTLTNNGTIKPGGTGTAGTLTITGNVVNGASGIIEAELGGPIAGSQYDVLAVSGNVTLGGTLNSPLINDFVPSGQSFDVITAGGTAGGSFTTLNLPSGVNGAIVGSVFRLTDSGVTCAGFCWDGGGGSDTLWSTAANWTNDAIPDSVGLAYLLVSGASATLNDSRTIEALFSEPGNNLTIATGGSLTLTGAATASDLQGSLALSGGNLTVNGLGASLSGLQLSSSTLGGSGNVTVTGGSTLGGSSTLAGSGTLTTNGASTLNGTLFLSRTWNNSGSGVVTVGGPGTVRYSGGGVINNAGTWNSDGTSTSSLTTQTGGGNIFNNSGTFNKNNAVVDTVFVDGGFNNSGVVNVASGTLVLNQGGTSSGSFNVSSPATLNLASGNQSLSASANITGTGAVGLTGATVNYGATALDLTGSLALTGGTFNLNTNQALTGAFTQSGGTLAGTGNLVLSGAAALGGSSTLAGSGTLTTNGASTLNGTLFLSRTWNNSGSGVVTVGGPGTVRYSGGGVINNAGTWNSDGTSTSSLTTQTGGGNIFNNSGTFNKNNAVVDTVFVDGGFNNSGVVNVASGTLVLNQGGTSSGSFNVSSPATLNLASGNQSLSASANITGTGAVGLTGATVNYGATALDLTGSLALTGGTFNLNTNQALTGAFTQSGGTLAGTGNLVLSGAAALGGSSTLAGSGTLTTNGASTLNGTLFLSRTWNNSGSGVVTVSGPGTVRYSGGGVINNAGTWNSDGTSTSSLTTQTGGGNIFNNSGTFNKNNAVVDTVFVDGGFNNSGVVNVASGTLVLNQGGTSSGSFNVSSPATLNLASGNQSLSASANITGTGAVGLTGATVNYGATALDLTGSLALTGGTFNLNTNQALTGAFTQSGGTLAGTGNLVLSGAAALGGSSTLAGSGTLTTNGASTLNGTLFLSRTWNNSGSGVVTVGGPGTVRYSGGGVINNAGTWNSDGTSTSSLTTQTGGGNIFNNSGTFNKNNAVVDTVFVDGGFNNSGTVNVSAGTLAIPNTLNQVGTLSVASGATLGKGGSFINEASGIIGGAGTVDVGAGNTLTNNGTLKPGGTGLAGTLAITGNLVNNGIIEAELGGPIAGSQYDVLAVSGNVTLGGTLNSPLINDFVPSGQSFDVITAGGTAGGSFTTLNLPSGVNGAIVGSVFRLTDSGVTCAGFCWDGGGGSDTLWSTAANWTNDAIPDSVGLAYLLVSGASATLNDSRTIEALFSEPGNNLTIATGGSLTLKGAATASDLQGSLAIDGGTLTASGALTAANLSLSSGALQIDGAATLTAYGQSGGSLGGSGILEVTQAFVRSGGTVAPTLTGVTINQASGDLQMSDLTVNGPLSLTATAGALNFTGTLRSGGAPINLNAAGALNLQAATVDASGAAAGGLVQLDGSSISLANSTVNTSGTNDGGQILIGLRTLPSSVTISNSSLIADPPALGGTIAIDGRVISIAGSSLNVTGVSGGLITLGSSSTSSLTLDALTSLIGGGGASFNLFASSIFNNATFQGGKLFVNGAEILGSAPASAPLFGQALLADLLALTSIDPLRSSQIELDDYGSPNSLLFTQWESLGIDPLSITLIQSAFLIDESWLASLLGPSVVWDWGGVFLSTDLLERALYDQPLLAANPLEPLVGSRLGASSLFPPGGWTNFALDVQLTSSLALAWPVNPQSFLSDRAGGLSNGLVPQLSPQQVLDQFASREQQAMDETAAKLGLDPTVKRVAPTPSEVQQSLRKVIQAVRQRVRAGAQ